VLADYFFMRKDQGVAVLIYHSISDDNHWLPWAWGTSLSVRAFTEQLSLLKNKGYQVLSDQQLQQLRQHNSPIPRRSVVLHFDDGYLDNYVAAAPLLRRYSFPATFFVSTEFIDPGKTLRPTLEETKSVPWAGYMNHLEIKKLDQDPLFRVESHGKGHGRVQISCRQITTIKDVNWRQMGWLQWAPGTPKHDWFHAEEPTLLPLGAPVFEHDSELIGKGCTNEGQESDQAYSHRVLTLLQQARKELEAILQRPVTMLCWPFDRTSHTAQQLAYQAGFQVTTGGKGNNSPSESWRVISRLHVPDRGWGWRWYWGEKWLFHARIRLYQGNYYWYYLIVIANCIRKFRHSVSPLS